MQYITLLLVSISIVWASPLTDTAYKACSQGECQKAIKLYKKASGTVSHRQKMKAYNNLGVMYLKGISAQKDHSKALYNFRMVALTGQGIIYKMSAFTDENLRIIHDTYQYLSHLEEKNSRRKEAKANILKVGAELKERKQFANAKKIEKTMERKRVGDYMKKCPAARSISVIKKLETKNKKPLTPKEKREAVEDLNHILDKQEISPHL